MSKTQPAIKRTVLLQPNLEGIQLQVSAYERTASMLVALLLLVGFFVGLLLVIAYTRRIISRPQPVAVLLLEEEASGRGDHPVGTGLEMAEPGADEFPQLSEPNFAEIANSLTGILSSEVTSLSTDGLATTTGTGAGDRRQPGPLSNADVIPRSERWDIAYGATALETYAAQLDFFGIELGVVGGGRKGVDYVRGFGKQGRQVRHSDVGDQEQRLFFTWRNGQLQQFDRQLVERAGIPALGRRVLQFYSPEVENSLAVLEQTALQGKPLKSVKKTRFGVRAAGAGYEHYVIAIEQRIF